MQSNRYAFAKKPKSNSAIDGGSKKELDSNTFF